MSVEKLAIVTGISGCGKTDFVSEIKKELKDQLGSINGDAFVYQTAFRLCPFLKGGMGWCDFKLWDVMHRYCDVDSAVSLTLGHQLRKTKEENRRFVVAEGNHFSKHNTRESLIRGLRKWGVNVDPKIFVLNVEPPVVVEWRNNRESKKGNHHDVIAERDVQKRYSDLYSRLEDVDYVRLEHPKSSRGVFLEWLHS